MGFEVRPQTRWALSRNRAEAGWSRHSRETEIPFAPYCYVVGAYKRSYGLPNRDHVETLSIYHDKLL